MAVSMVPNIVEGSAHSQDLEMRVLWAHAGLGCVCGGVGEWVPSNAFSAECNWLTLSTARKHFVETHIWWNRTFHQKDSSSSEDNFLCYGWKPHFPKSNYNEGKPKESYFVAKLTWGYNFEVQRRFRVFENIFNYRKQHRHRGKFVKSWTNWLEKSSNRITALKPTAAPGWCMSE